MNDLPSLIQQAPESATAIIIPETGASITYGSLRKQVHSLAESMAGAGIAAEIALPMFCRTAWEPLSHFLPHPLPEPPLR